VDVETANAFPACNAITNIQQTSLAATDLFDPTTTVFTATGSMVQDREAYGAAILTKGANLGDLAVFGGACTPGGTLSSFVIGTSGAATGCDAGAAPNNYYEFFAPGTGTWTAGTAAQPTTPTNGLTSSLLP
jgi:hypothetical protein